MPQRELSRIINGLRETATPRANWPPWWRGRLCVQYQQVRPPRAPYRPPRGRWRLPLGPPVAFLPHFSVCLTVSLPQQLTYGLTVAAKPHLSGCLTKPVGYVTRLLYAAFRICRPRHTGAGRGAGPVPGGAGPVPGGAGPVAPPAGPVPGGMAHPGRRPMA